MTGEVADTPPPKTSRLGRNTAINVAGTMSPLLVSLLTVPPYLHLIGQTRYGVLAIIWVVLGYFAVFDLGLSRATANQVARMRDDPAEEREAVFWTALTINASVGAGGGVLLFVLGRLLIGSVISVAPSLHAETVGSLPWLAAAVPLTTATLVLAGTLEGQERFLTLNILSVIALTLFQTAPLAYAYWVGPSLAGLLMSATLALLASTVLSLVVIAVTLPLRGRPRIDRARLGALLRYGGWITVTGIVGPVLTVLDRILIGALLSARAVTQYAVPFALVSRAQILSTSLARTIFPRFSMLETADAAAVSRESVRALAAVMTVVSAASAVVLEPFLRVWIGGSLGAVSAPVGEILIFGLWLNSMAVVPFAFLQAQRRPDLPAKFHLAEVIPYVGGLVLALHFAGIQGAAAAWSARAGVDAVLLFWAAHRVAQGSEPSDVRILLRGAVFVVAAFVASLTIFHVTAIRIGLGGLLVVGSAAWAWTVAPADIRARLRRR